MNIKKLNEDLASIINEISPETKKSYMSKRQAQMDRFNKAKKYIETVQTDFLHKLADTIAQELDYIPGKGYGFVSYDYYGEVVISWGYVPDYYERNELYTQSNAFTVSFSLKDQGTKMIVNYRYTSVGFGQYKVLSGLHKTKEYSVSNITEEDLKNEIINDINKFIEESSKIPSYEAWKKKLEDIFIKINNYAFRNFYDERYYGCLDEFYIGNFEEYLEHQYDDYADIIVGFQKPLQIFYDKEHYGKITIHGILCTPGRTDILCVPSGITVEEGYIEWNEETYFDLPLNVPVETFYKACEQTLKELEKSKEVRDKQDNALAEPDEDK